MRSSNRCTKPANGATRTIPNGGSGLAVIGSMLVQARRRGKAGVRGGLASRALPLYGGEILETTGWAVTSPLDRLRASLAGRYTIDRELGRGGMATVYLAEDLKHRRLVALKLLRPDLAAALGTERFLQEIDIAAHLQHPNVLPLYDSGEADGLLYYVMPRVDGESLRDRLEREVRLSVDDALQILREIAGALSYAHAHGVVHRDVKPENILLSSGRAVVAALCIPPAPRAPGGQRRRRGSNHRNRIHGGHARVHESRTGDRTSAHRRPGGRVQSRLRVSRDAHRCAPRHGPRDRSGDGSGLLSPGVSHRHGTRPRDRSRRPVPDGAAIRRRAERGGAG